MIVYTFTGDLPVEEKDKQISAGQFIGMLGAAVAARGWTLEVLDDPNKYDGSNKAVFFWTDKLAADMRAILRKYPRITFVNHPLVHQRGEWFRWSKGYPNSVWFPKRAALAELPPNRVLKPLDNLAERNARRLVVLMPATPEAGIFHNSPPDEWEKMARAWVEAKLPGAEIQISMHPNIAKQRGLPTTDEMLPTACLGITEQSGAAFDKFLANGIPVLVSRSEFPLTSRLELPSWAPFRYISQEGGMARQAMLTAGAYEVPAAVEGMEMLLAA